MLAGNTSNRNFELMAILKYFRRLAMTQSSGVTTESFRKNHEPIRSHSQVKCQPTMTAFLLVFACGGIVHAQGSSVVCRDGEGAYETAFASGMNMHVRAVRNDELAKRACEAMFTWNGTGRLVISSEASVIDIDALGVDFGMDAPVAAFQVKKSKTDCCVEYQLYSMQEPPRLIRTITGGDYFRSADTDLDGRAEIWTDDAASVDGFESMSANQLDFAPPMVLRFENKKLVDVGSEFQSYFDDKIKEERSGIDSQQLDEFRKSDGRLAPDSLALSDRYRLQKVKIKVLEIVWCYLYSGREQDAWKSLAEFWPPADIDRIRSAILNARSHGIRTQLDGDPTEFPNGSKKHAHVYDAGTRYIAYEGEKDTKLAVVPPVPILMERPSPMGTSGHSLTNSEVQLDLVINCAGKVRSASPEEGAQWFDAALLVAAETWKFIPALRAGHPVASRIHYTVSLRR
jgi:hypothetical protein